MSEEKKDLPVTAEEADEKEANDVWTRDQSYGGVGEELDPETITVEDEDENVFAGFEADEEVDVEKMLDEEHEKMEKGDAE